MAELNLNVNVETKGAQKLDTIGNKLKGAGKLALVGLGAATAGATALGAVVVSMASDAEQAQTKLQSIFDGTNAAAFTSIDALNAHAEALAAATTFDDDAVKGAQATLLSFGNIVGDSFTEATEASADLAAFMGTDITAASKTLGKALAIPEAAAGKLAKQGIILTEQQKEQIDAFVEAGDTAAAQGVILDAVSSKMGTVAEDLAGTAGGQVTVAMNQLGEAGESLGVILLPVLAAVAQGIKGFADFVIANMPVIQEVIGTVFGFIGGLFSSVGASTGGLQQLFAGLVAWVQANLPTIMSVASQVFGAVANVVKAVAPPIIELAKIVLPALGVAAGILFKVLDVAFKGIGGAFEVLGNVFTTVADVISSVFDGVIGFFKGIYNAFAAVWNSIQISVPSIEIPFVGTVGGFSIGLPDLPFLARGGIVTSPTLALIGESGPEAVIPLGASGMPGTVNNFNFTTQAPTPDPRALVQLVERSQRLQGMLVWD